MSVRLNPYIGFRDEARAALEFYHSIFGGELAITTFAEMHASEDPADADKVMHGYLEGENGLVLMGSDAPSSMEPSTGSSISIALTGDDDEAMTRYWDGLADGATVLEALSAAPWGGRFGMLTDRFGTTWLVNASGAA